MVRQSLEQIVRQHGPEVADDERRLDALLTAALGPRYPHETLLLVSAAMCGIPAALRTLGKDELDNAELSRLTKRLQTEFGASENLARSAVICWASALGLIRPDAGDKKPSGAADGADAEAEAAPAEKNPQEGVLQRAIRAAMADGVVTAQEKAELQALAIKVRQQLGQKDAAPAGRSRRWVWIAAGAGVVVLLLVIWGIIASQRTRKPQAAFEAPGWVPTTAEVARVRLDQRVTALRASANKLGESVDAAIAAATAARDAHLGAQRDTMAFHSRLDRALRQARDQGRATFRMGGKAYTHPQAAAVLEAAAGFAQERVRSAEAISARLEALAALKPLVSAVQQMLGGIDPDKSDPALDAAQAELEQLTLRLSEMGKSEAPPAFDIDAALRAAGAVN